MPVGRATATQIASNIPGNESPLLCVGEQTAKARQNLARHGGTPALGAKAIFERSHGGNGDFAQQCVPDKRNNVQIEVLPVLSKRRSLKPGCFSGGKPQAAGKCNRATNAVGNMETFADFNRSRRREGVGFLLGGELLGAAFPLAITVVDLPGLLVQTSPLTD
jgi:hypothetical protein